MTKTIRDFGEQGLLKKLKAFCPPEIVGDDGAVLTLTNQHNLVVTTDILVDGVHFSDRTTPPDAVGWRGAAANLSDLAAMGATPIGITVGLSLTGDTPISWVESLYQGLSNCLQQYKTGIVGGDICRSQVNTLAITAFGQVSPNRVICRSTAQPGDAIVVTGYHGNSRAGLELLLNPPIGNQISPTERKFLLHAHQYPQPRLDVLQPLWRLNQGISVAGMDSSDGLADGIVQICQSSGVGAQIIREAIPIYNALSNLVAPEKAWEWILYGGEDFELVLCLKNQIATELVSSLGQPATIIGKITAEKDIKLIDTNGGEELLTLTKGFKHF